MNLAMFVGLDIVFLLLLILCIVKHNENNDLETYLGSILSGVALGITSFAMLIKIGIMDEVTKVTYVEPSSVNKTEDYLTIVSLDGEVLLSTRDAEFYSIDKTNMWVEITSGNNMYGKPVSDTKKVVIK